MKLESAAEKFLRYVVVWTTSEENVMVIPSTPRQWNLARLLMKEMQTMGISNVTLSENCYVYGEIPANTEEKLPAVGFVAHMDTAPDAPGYPVKPRIVSNYDGGAIVLNDHVTLDPEHSPSITRYIGEDLIVTDGNTLLGADDKAGIAEILAMAEYILAHPEIKHGKICIGFTPDEEVGRGPDAFDVETFGADFGYTVDGGTIGEIEYENFNAASADVTVKGFLIHPGSAKDIMKNASTIAMEFDRMIPQSERPETSEGYEGYYYLQEMSGTTIEAKLHYIMRDFELEGMEARKELMRNAAKVLNERFGDCVTVTFKDSYHNMKEKILPHIELIDAAKAAFTSCGVESFINPCRGGTDGATLSFMGLPCPNLSAGGENMHSVTEYVSVQSLEKMTDVLIAIVKNLAE